MDRQVGTALESLPAAADRSMGGDRWPAAVALAATLGLLTLLVLAAGQPIITDDVWWHLAMGERYADQGPWLADDPMLHTAIGPASPAAWLSDVLLHGVERAVGLPGLRVVHGLLVVVILVLVAAALRRASGSVLYACLGTGLVAVLAAYRLVQIRPHLLSILCTLLLLRLLGLDGTGRRPDWPRVSLAVALLVVWANLHAAVLLGPLLIGSACLGIIVAARFGQDNADSVSRERLVALASAFVLGLLATLLNPEGPAQLLHYFEAGQSTPALEVVGDEWAPVRLLSLPRVNMPPSGLAWGVTWLLCLATPGVLVWDWLARGRKQPAAPDTRPAARLGAIDPALAACALAALILMLTAVRFLWLGVLPLMLLGSCRHLLPVRSGAGRRVARWSVAMSCVLLIPAFLRVGDWPMISRALHPSLYARTYPAIKYHANSVWLLADAGLEGNLMNDYFMGNFLGYWLAPDMRGFLNGSLNFPADAMQAGQALLRREGVREGETFESLLDRYEVDVFIGTGMPVVPLANRATGYTTAHLEDTPGWIPIFRNVQGAVYLRVDARNAKNLSRIESYYQRARVPFDPRFGFDAVRVIREAPQWAIDHMLVPANFRQLESSSLSDDPAIRSLARERLASLYVLLGLYDKAVSIDRRLVGGSPPSVAAAKRLVWSELQREHFEEAAAAAAELEAIAAADDRLATLLIEAVTQAAKLTRQEARAYVATLPVFTRAERTSLFVAFSEPEPRVRAR